MKKERFIVKKSYLQIPQHSGEVWLIHDTLHNETLDGYYRHEALANLEIEDLNEKWKKDLENTRWQRDSLFFSFIHYYYNETTDIELNTLIDYDYDERIDEIRLLQNKRGKILFGIHLDIIDSINSNEKVTEYNQIVKDENGFRNDLYLKELKELKTNKDFHTAIIELQKWTLYLLENRNPYIHIFT